ncbi:MAG: 16S rRNA (guanine(966)-N(2))-methyltransferase RsmD [Methylotenera sp.]|uniref:16S rRNA (guanine(966)-N(2))-methyltransferase RsmD n=1 Tax=Methylotenera sp. TaxID=2051956 RepID=UPI000D498691|nr:16S rRNA (guanine(966)-N(2))-methyltransferase RsmD [Methylotenera sp.]PPC83293.1 MAG: 16S rRNA (guanine(966)-N(2))-methyltransferase RsmD [Methylotenera sp.]
MAEKKSNTVRINAGEWRSRLLKFPDAQGLRPTPERVRQTVFNWLGQDLTGQVCLDLFAGTGVMGFEALSRHAKSVVMVEKAMPVYKAILDNKSTLKADAALVLNIDALGFLDKNQQLFDVIFLDPPYHQGWLEKVLAQLPKHLSPQGVVYVEAEYAVADSEIWQVLKQSKAGNVFYHLIKLRHDTN